MCKRNDKKTYAEREFEYDLSCMRDGSAKSYIKGYIIPQIAWFDKKSVGSQKKYKAAVVASIFISGVTIPLITLLLDIVGVFAYKLVITSLSSCLTVVSAINALGRFRELWIQYRRQCESIRCMLHNFFTVQGDTGLDNACSFDTLKKSFEECMNSENENWAALIPAYNSDHSSISS